jgi:hypothetical protein
LILAAFGRNPADMNDIKAWQGRAFFRPATSGQMAKPPSNVLAGRYQ